MIRPPSAATNDLQFVRSAWLKSYASSEFARWHTPKATWEKNQASDDYYDGQRGVIEALLGRAKVLVNEDEAEGLQYLTGFLVYEPLTVHYVYVRQSARGQGIARALIDAAGIPRDGSLAVRYTHRARGIESSRLPRGWSFRLFPIMVGGRAA